MNRRIWLPLKCDISGSNYGDVGIILEGKMNFAEEKMRALSFLEMSSMWDVIVRQ